MSAKQRPPVAVVDTVKCLGCDAVFSSPGVWREAATPGNEVLVVQFPLCRECDEHAEWCSPFWSAVVDRALDRLATDRELGDVCLR